ncbi:MAG: flagellar protein FlgN [candidate division Zixibacteria bacterium]
MKNTEYKYMDGTIEKLLDRLISVIGSEAILFEKFLELLEIQQKALVENNTEELQSVTSQLQKIALESKHLEDERAEIVETIQRREGAQADLNVLRICEMTDRSRSTQLRTLRETVLSLYSQIEETRMRNGLLIKQSMDQIRNTMESIGRIPAQKDIYQGKGNISKEYAPIGVDRRV